MIRAASIGGIVGVCLWWATSAQAQTAPALVGAVSNSSSLAGASSVAVYHSPATGRDYAVTTAYWPGQLTVVDISNPSSPTIVGSTSTNATQLQNGSNVAVVGNDAFVVSKNRNGCANPPTCNTFNNDDGSGNSLTIVDLSTPSAPTVMGTIQEGAAQGPTAPFGFYGIAVAGGYAYVAAQGIVASQPTAPQTSYGAFAAFDIANPSAPTLAATIDNGSLPPGWAGRNVLAHADSVQLSGHYAYVTASDDDRVTVIDISNPAAPVIVSSIRDHANLVSPADLAVQGNYVYVANQTAVSNQFTILNISNPGNPTVVGSLNNALLSGAYRVRVRGDFAYVAASDAATIAVIDISDPTHPRLVAAVTDTANLNTATGLDLGSSGRYLVANSPRLSGQSGSSYPPYPITTGTISVIDLEPSPFAVSIAAAARPPSVTARNSASFRFSTTDEVAALQCSLDGAAAGPCASATSQKYSRLAKGTHTFKVTATASTGATSSASYSWFVGKLRTAVLRGSLSGTTARKQRLTVTLPRSLGSVRMITLTPPSGVKFRASQNQLARAITVRLGHKRLRFSSTLQARNLVITLPSPAKGITLTINGSAMSLSRRYERTLAARHGRALAVRLKLRYG